MKEATATRTANLRKLKASIDKFESTVNGANTYLPKLKTKGYPAAMMAYYVKKINPQKEMLAKKVDVWAMEAKKPEPRDTDMIEEITKLNATIESDIGMLDKADKDFKNDTLSELKRVTA